MSFGARYTNRQGSGFFAATEDKERSNNTA